MIVVKILYPVVCWKQRMSHKKQSLLLKMFYSLVGKFTIQSMLPHQENNCLHINKGDVKRRNTLGCLDQYTCRRLRLSNSQDHETVKVYKHLQRMETETIDTMKQSRQSWLFCIFFSGKCIYSVGESGPNESLNFNLIWSWRLRLITPKTIGILTNTGGHRTRVAAVTLDNMAERVSAQREDLP